MFTSLVFLVFMFTPYSSDASGAPWAYSGETGPEYWSTLENNEACAGSSQSPINVDTAKLVSTHFKDWDFINYDMWTSNETYILNNGHAVEVNLNVAGDIKVTGGGLPSTYKALQLHFHWGETSNAGSEHIRNGAAFPLEMHIVHWNSRDFPAPPFATPKPQGLAVLGVWFEVGEENMNFNTIVDAIENVTYKDTKYTLPESFRLQDLLPEDTASFYRYSGSLTTPPCYESVVWTVFANPIQLSAEQIAKFREATETHAPENNTVIVDPYPIDPNYRPVQDIGGRDVYVSGGIEATAPSTTAGAMKAANHYHVISLVFLASIVHLINICRRYL